MRWDIVFIVLLIGALVGLCLWIIIKPPFGKGSGWGTAQAHVQNLMMGVMDNDKKKAIEYIQYEKEDAEREDDEGDDKSRFEGDES